MAHKGLAGFDRTLQSSIQPSDQEWAYTIPDLPRASVTNFSQHIKSISVVSDTSRQRIALKYVKHQENRAVDSELLDQYIAISFDGFRLQHPPNESKDCARSSQSQPASPKESADYIFRLLKHGICLNGTRYRGYGHSNSQLKSKSCYLYAASTDEIMTHIEGMGDFSKIKSVAKYVKRIGLLFSSAKVATELCSDRCQDIADITKDDYIFTDGCGLIANHLAQLLVQRLDLRFRNTRYLPSVFQIRYAGYKGVLTLEPKLYGQILVQFRESMRKVKNVASRSFAVIDHSRPYGFGYLNDEIVLLLHALGINESTLLKRQQEYLEFLSKAASDPQIAFRCLSSLDDPQKAEQLLIEGIDSVRPAIRKHIASEHNKMINKRSMQRCRILVPQSRLLFGICDPRGVLKPGECALRVTMEHGGFPRTISGSEVLVTRNPCLHPGDLQKFKAVQYGELAHLTDCIVFPTKGRRPSADLMSGGDLDGDKFFVCWDPDLIPSTIAEAADYKGPPEPVTFKKITHEDRLAYFAGYTNASLGRVKKLYLDWARQKGPMSSECQELNHLFSRCVDGNRIKVPPHLENVPKSDALTPDFILDTLHRAAENLVATAQTTEDIHELPVVGIELFLSRDRVMFSEFELFKMTITWCSRNHASIMDYVDFFDFGQMLDEQRLWVLAQLPPGEKTQKMVMNDILQSSLLSPAELQACRLDLPRIRWRRIYDSSIDRLGRFMEATEKAMEMFHRKLIVTQIDSRLTIAIYIPKLVTKYQETIVDDSVRLLSFPHSRETAATYRQIVPTKMDYRLYFDHTGIQLYEKQRGNTWVFLKVPGQDDAPYHNIEYTGDKRRARHAAVESGLNSDLVASIALNKFSSQLARHAGRVNRSPILGAEVYVISNRDTRSLHILDQWIHHVDTKEELPLFDDTEREYEEPNMRNVDWAIEPDLVRFIARDKRFETLDTPSQSVSIPHLFKWLVEHGQKSTLRTAYTYILTSPSASEAPVLGMLIDFLTIAPTLAIAYAQLGEWEKLPLEMRDSLNERSGDILKALATSAVEMQSLIVAPFKYILTQISHMRLDALAPLLEHISMVVRSPEIALDLLTGCLEQESSRIFSARPREVQYLMKNCIGIAIEHIEEAVESRATRPDLLSLRRTDRPNYVIAHIRIDSSSSVRFAINDHVQLTAASLPENSWETRACSMDALVQKSEPGTVTLECLHPLPSYVEACSWKVKNAGSFVTSKTMFSALSDFINFPEERCLIRNNLLGSSDCGDHITNVANHGYSGSNDLNESQSEAIIAALTSDLTCIWGPPGTGKTHTIAVFLELLVADPKRRILVTAPTHNAVDNVMRKYLFNVKRHSRPEPTGALRVSTDIRKVAEDLRAYTCDAMLGKDLNEDHAGRRKAQKRIKDCRLVFTTCIGAGLGLLRSEPFDTVIIDEASQQVEPTSLVPLVKGCAKAILVGDHVQLRATTHPHSQLIGFDVSLFERLYNAREEDKRLRKVMLDTQYRMHESICAFSSAEFYEGKLRTAVAESTRPLLPTSFPWSQPVPGKAARMFFVQCSAPEDFGRQSKSNAGQAQVMKAICNKLLARDENDKGLTPPSIAALVPYSRQAEALKDLKGSGVAVNTIDGFQGREADVVIFGTTRCNVHAEIGFLKDLRRLNVVLTRAKSAFIVVGDEATLTRGDEAEEATRVWKRLMGRMTPLAVDV